MKLKAKPGVQGIYLMGFEYVANAEGYIFLPNDLVPVALANGFELPDASATTIEVHDLPDAGA